MRPVGERRYSRGYACLGLPKGAFHPMGLEFLLGPPSQEQLAGTVHRRLERELLRPALEAEDGQAFEEYLFAHLWEFLQKALAISELVDVRAVPHETVEHTVVGLAAEYGGEAWSDAVADGFARFRRARRIIARLRRLEDLCLEDLGPAMATYLGASFVWSWNLACLGALHKNPRLANHAVRSRVLELLGDAPEKAFTTLRALEIEQQRELSEELLSQPLEGEERTLEQEAEAESQHLLNRIESEDENPQG